MYLQDNDSRYPFGEGYVGPQSDRVQNGLGWYDSIYPYVKDAQLFFCPSLKYSTSDGNRSHYATNDNLACCMLPQDGLAPPYLESKITWPATTILLTDCQPNSYGLNPNGTVSWYAMNTGHQGAGILRGRIDQNPGSASYETFKDRHLGGANYAFTDGHVKWELFDNISDAAVTGSEPHWYP
jgi:prepilin-type processing-associated H-X9-DG protein